MLCVLCGVWNRWYITPTPRLRLVLNQDIKVGNQLSAPWVSRAPVHPWLPYPFFMFCSKYLWPWTRTCSFSRCCIRGFQQCTVVKNDAAQHHDGPTLSRRVSRGDFPFGFSSCRKGNFSLRSFGFVLRLASWAEIDRNIRLCGCSKAHARFPSRDFGKCKYVWKCNLRVWIIGMGKLEPCVKYPEEHSSVCYVMLIQFKRFWWWYC